MTPSRHARYAVAAGLALTVTACGGGAGAPPASSGVTASSSAVATTPPSAKTPTTPPPAGDAPQARSIAIAIKGKSVTPAPATVDLKVGETLTLVVTSDHDDELHAHGFDVETKLVAGAPTTVLLTGRQAGLYEVETHETPLRLLMVAVR